jgi:hypothetical protein
LCQFQPDIAAADDDQVVGQSVELQRLDIGERLCCSKTRNIRDRGMRTEIECHAIAGQHTRTAVIQIHLDRLRRDEPARTHNQLSATGLVFAEVHSDQALDHLALARQHSLHVGGNGTRHHSEPIRVVNQIGDFCAPNFVFTGKAVGVRAGAADQFALDDGSATPRLRHLPSQQFAACATAEDEQLIAFRLGQFQLPRDCSAASGAANANARRSKPILSIKRPRFCRAQG